MKINVSTLAKEMNIAPMKLAYSIRCGLYSWAKAEKKSKAKNGKYTYYFDEIEAVAYLAKYKKIKKMKEID